VAHRVGVAVNPQQRGCVVQPHGADAEPGRDQRERNHRDHGVSMGAARPHDTGVECAPGGPYSQREMLRPGEAPGQEPSLAGVRITTGMSRVVFFS
jgi:hypothetical protein